MAAAAVAKVNTVCFRLTEVPHPSAAKDGLAAGDGHAGYVEGFFLHNLKKMRHHAKIV